MMDIKDIIPQYRLGEKMYYIDIPDFSFGSFPSFSIFVDKCLLGCKYCEFKRILGIRNFVKLNSLTMVMDKISILSDFYDKIVVCGGEPLLDLKLLNSLIDLKKILSKDIILYTSLYPYHDIVNKFDRVYVDVKGRNIKEVVMNIGKGNEEIAERLLSLYKRFADDDRFVFRIPSEDYLDVFDFKNYELYKRINL